jgi:ketosteroid isomerase-like protein
VSATSNVEVFREAWDAYACGRTDVLLAFLHPDIRWEPALVDGGFHGPEAFESWLLAAQRQYKSMTVVLETVREVADDCIVAFGRVTAFDYSGEQSHDAAVAWVAEFRAGRVIRATTFTDRDEALRYVTDRRERF